MTFAEPLRRPREADASSISNSQPQCGSSPSSAKSQAGGLGASADKPLGISLRPDLRYELACVLKPLAVQEWTRVSTY
ncbi:hypothetical protein [Streptomyces sp. SAI-127]|uniref:hypothetical protein n=1 Tax=Streptomyces sp. SAI-127 TaxID=2940543 RepID=UPI0024757A0C|nr:hypothetical protein [Streptomyces sp. SAI-127]MDH6484397.1 hypothetical protein [Streptomyces sp. SAI-127]